MVPVAKNKKQKTKTSETPLPQKQEVEGYCEPEFKLVIGSDCDLAFLVLVRTNKSSLPSHHVPSKCHPPFQNGD